VSHADVSSYLSIMWNKPYPHWADKEFSQTGWHSGSAIDVYVGGGHLAW